MLKIDGDGDGHGDGDGNGGGDGGEVPPLYLRLLCHSAWVGVP